MPSVARLKRQKCPYSHGHAFGGPLEATKKSLFTSPSILLKSAPLFARPRQRKMKKQGAAAADIKMCAPHTDAAGVCIY